MEIHHGSYRMELTPWKLPHGTLQHRCYLMQIAPKKFSSCNLHHGSYLMELTLLKLPHGTYIIEVT